MSVNPPTRFLDDGTQMVDFLKCYVVACPSCGGAAIVSITDKTAFVLFAPRRLTCVDCGFTKNWAESGLAYPAPEEAIDWYFRAPFYFQRRCAGHQLWVANREHLEFLRSYVAAYHRNRRRDAQGWRNKSMASRIPKWISQAKNRQAVLRALADLEKKMNTISLTSRLKKRRGRTVLSTRVALARVR